MDPEFVPAGDMPTNNWAERRKTFFIGIIVLLLSSITFAFFWRYWYATPTCFDGKKNGSETGVDCGGNCSLVCSGGVIRPIIKWDPRLFEVMPGVWSALVYVENPNVNIDATYVPYSFTIYDSNNQVLVERKGATILPKNRMVGIFEGSISLKTKPKRAVFELGDNIIWNKNEETEYKLTISHGPLLKLDSSPKIEASVKNEDIREIKNIELVAVVFDGSDNAIAASRTFIESLKKNDKENIFFTWPNPFNLGTKVCEKNSDIMLLLDRSGSMASVSKSPPEPLSSVKTAATYFIEQLTPGDKVGLVSFASSPKEPIDLNLTSDFNLAKQVVASTSIDTNGTQYTNIYGALHSAWQELISARSQSNSSKIVILLTDGVANNPKDPQGKTEADDIKYAENLALKEATEAKKDGLIIYTIGLGKNINEAFLKSVASDIDSYFFAPSAVDLENIYKNISSDICKEVPARIEITYKIFGDSI